MSSHGLSGISHFFNKMVTKYPHRCAVKYKEKSLTYSELDLLSSRIASFISCKYKNKLTGQNIVIAIERSPETIASILAVLKLGATYVPFDPTSPDERLKYMLEDCQAGLLITSRDHAGQQNCCSEIYIEDLPDTIPPFSPPVSHDISPAYIMYTSGSTGQPKGVVVPHQGVLRLVLAAAPLQFTANSVIAQSGNIAFDASTLEIWGALLNGATLVVIPYEVVIDSRRLAHLLKQEKITDAFFTVALFNQLATDNNEVFGGLDNVLTGGDALSPAAVKAVMHSACPPGAVWNAYGPTENTVITTLHCISKHDCERTSIPIGKAISGTQCYVLNDRLQLVETGEEGELYTSGTGLAHGYLNKPDKTAEAFLPNVFYELEKKTTPLTASAVMYKTGDRVKTLPDGSLDFVGRSDSQVKIRGFRLETGEVEYRLCQIPGVELAVVSAISHDGQKQLVAWYQGSADAGQVLKLFSEQVPAYMVPASLQAIAQFPLSPNGKVDKRRLPPPQFIQQAYVAAQTATEQMLDEIWQTLLKQAQPVGRAGNFFSLGGHSLLVVKLQQAITDRSGKALPLRELFANPVLADMAACIDSHADESHKQTMPVVPPGNHIPLSEAQQRLWISCIRQPEIAHYAIPLAFRLEGEVNVARLQQAITKLSERHHSLRLRIANKDGVPVQYVASEPLTLTVKEMDSLAPGSLTQQVREEAGLPFAFGETPLARITLYRTRHATSLLLINLHHIITDGWSMGVFFSELSALYSEDDQSLPVLQNQFTDYCAWMQKQDLHADLDYWKQQLAGVQPLELPVTGTPAAGTICRSKTFSVALHQQLKSVATSVGSGMFTLVYSAIALMLSRLTGQQDVPVSCIWANRPWSALNEMIGFFANTLIMRTHVTDALTVKAWLESNHQMLTAGFEHGAAPLGQVLMNTEVACDASQHPLCSVLLVMQNTDGGDGKGLILEGCAVSDYALPAEPAKSDLLFNVVPQRDGQLRVECSFREGIWPEVLMDSLLDYLHHLLVQISENLAMAIGDLPDVDDKMRHTQLLSWNPGKKELSDKSLLPHFAHWVASSPDALAVSDAQQQWSYHELDQRANSFANQIQRAMGDLTGTRVVFALDRDCHTVAMMLAIVKMGAVYVPFDPAHPDERLHYVLNDCQARCLITLRRDRDRQALCPEIYLEDLLSPLSTDSDFSPAPLTATSTAYIMYTSGSTGEPKGVEVLHQGITRLTIEAGPYQISASAVVAQAGNIAFDASTLEIWGALLNGAHLVVIPFEVVIDSCALPRLLRDKKITDAWFTVALFNQLATENPAAFGGLRNLLIGGDALNPSLVAAVLQSAAPPDNLWNGYGPTENTTFTTLHNIALEECFGSSVPIGQAISGTTCYVLDERLRLLPPGVPGELYTSGAGLAKGYLNKPEKTAEAFIANPYWQETQDSTPASPWLYKTGDRVRWKEEGVLEFLGRNDNQVKIRGFRLEPGEVESRLCQLEGVSQAVVSAVPHNNQKQLVAWCVSTLSATQILQMLRDSLPAYMVPASLQTVAAMPLTQNGKVDRKRLPPADFSVRSSNGTAPQSATECQLAEIWQHLLNLPERCSREDNFFDIGGHSLMVIRMTDLINKQMGKTVSVARVFNSDTLASLAAFIDGEHVEQHDTEAQMIEEDCRLTLPSFKSAAHLELNSVLLTGASGFLGIYLLATLQQTLPDTVVYCLVRDKDALQRVLKTAQDYQLTVDQTRIKIVEGDLAQPLLGISPENREMLEQNIDAIYHCGAWVNHLHRYERLRAANVQSTHELLRLCTKGKEKQFYYVSTLSAAAVEQGVILENKLADSPPMKNGYVQSKWVGEKLLTQAFSRGLYGAIYRMGNITGSTRNGISNVATNHTLNLIKGCLQQGVAPAWPGYQLDISPVDRLATLLVTASTQRHLTEQAINLGYLVKLPWRTLLERCAKLGYPLRFVSAAEWALNWVPQIASDNAMYPFKSFYLEPQEHSPVTIEQKLVAQRGMTFDTDKLLSLYCTFWAESQFIKEKQTDMVE